jgi:hypothetical protein
VALVAAAVSLAACADDEPERPGPVPDASEAPEPDPDADPDEGALDDGPVTDEDPDLDDPDLSGEDPEDGAADAGTADGTADAGADAGTADGTADDGSEDEDDVPPLDEVATPDEREEASDGSDLTVTAVRVGAHDGFDRVTVELAGDAGAGWFASYTDGATEDGSGREVDVAGGGVLTLSVRGVVLPPDRPEDVDPFDGTTVAAPEGAGTLTEVVEGVVYEGQHQLFLGVDEEVPFRLERLEDPQRIAIDLVHGEDG